MEFPDESVDLIYADPPFFTSANYEVLWGDGYELRADGSPVQVKQSEDVGRNVVDNFETAIRRAKKTKSMIGAFSFGKGAYEEVARVKNAEALDITLKTTKELVEEE